MGKGEIAHYKQFLLFPQCFQKACTVDTLKPGFVWERVKCLFCVIHTTDFEKVSFGILGKETPDKHGGLQWLPQYN